MAKFKVPAPKYITQLRHHLLHDEEGETIWHDDALQKLKLWFKHKMTPEEYINIQSGAYGHSSFRIRQLLKYLKESKHNTPENNTKALAIALADFNKENGIGSSSAAPRRKATHVDFGASEDAISNLIDSHGAYRLKPEAIDYLVKQHIDSGHHKELAQYPHLEPSHLKQLIDAGKEVDVEHPKFDRSLSYHLIYNSPKKLSRKQFKGMLKTLKHADPNKRLIANKDLLHLIKNPDKLEDGAALSYAMDHYEPPKNLLGEPDHSEVHNAISRVIGHKGSEQYYGNDEDANYPETNYQLMQRGPGYRKSMAHEILRNSKNLSPEHIDFVKRHGSFEDKWALFHNPYIDKRHQIEMHNRWANNESDKGYDKDDLKDHIKEENSLEDRYDDYYEDARSQVTENYPISQHIRDNASEEDYFYGQSSEEWKQDYLANNYNWDHEGEDYSSSIEDHPEYQDRYNEAESAYEAELDRRKNDIPDHTLDQWYDSYNEAISEDITRIAEQMHDEKMENAHLDYQFLPDHLEGHLPAVEEHIADQRLSAEEKARVEAARKEKELLEFLGDHIPKRNNVHTYGEMQHHIELARHYADANGGSIDIGHLNKIHPNNKETWKKIFGPKGKLSSQELQQIHDFIPKTKYNVSYGKWNGDQMQNINGRDQVIVRLDHSPESAEPLKADPETYKIFQKIQEVSQRSGHPTNINTIAWARVDMNDPNHWMIDEVQSDFGSSARDYLESHGKSEEAAHVDKIINYHKNWREALINKVVNLAKDNGVNVISTHSPESKSAHTSSDKIHSVYKDSYQKVPRSMGFKPVHMDRLPLTEDGQKIFKKGRSGTDPSRLQEDHESGMETHAWLHNAHKNLAEAKRYPVMPGVHEGGDMTPEQVELHQKLADHHRGLFDQHQKRMANLDPTHFARFTTTPNEYIRYMTTGGRKMWPDQISNAQNSNRIKAYINVKEIQDEGYSFPTFGHDSALKEEVATDPHPGHQLDLTPAKLKKSIDDSEFDIEFEKLQKAPPVENTELESFEDWHPIPKSYKFMGSKPLKDGMHHHIYSGHYGPNKSPIFYHGISDSPSPDAGTIARVQVSIDETTGEPIVTESHVHPDFKGQNLGKKAYAAALAYHGKLESDYAVSRHAQKAWEVLKDLPGVHVSTKELGNPDPNRAKAYDVRALRNHLYKNDMLHGQPTWSDTLKKKEKLDPDQIKQLVDLLEDLETVDVDMPWNDIIRSSTHRWR